MSRFRKITIWCVAVSALIIVFRLYSRITGVARILPPPKDPKSDIGIPRLQPDASRIGPAVVDNVVNSSYRFHDEVTKKLKREFGFRKLLNPGDRSRKWQLVSPYMCMYEDSFVCRITSERGTVQVETVDNNPTPTDAELYDNVVIRIESTDAGRPLDSVIYMDRLRYNSERSEFYTDGPIKLVSQKVEMEGRGLVLIYNETMGRIEFLKVVILDYLRLKDVAGFSSKSRPGARPSDAVSATPAKPVGVRSGVAARSAKPASQKTPGAADSADTKDRPPRSPDDFYECTFSRDVVIEYGDEIIIEGADEISIRCLDFSEGNGVSGCFGSRKGDPRLTGGYRRTGLVSGI